MRPLALLAVALAAGPAAAQPLVYPAAAPESSGARFPRVRRGLQVFADPTLLRPSAAGRPGSPVPVLDAAPVAADLAGYGLMGAGAAANAIAYGLPPALRLVRVMVAGRPPAADSRRETLLWVASPMALAVRNRMQERRSGGGCAPPRRLCGRR